VFVPAFIPCLLSLETLAFANTKNNRYLATGWAKPLQPLGFLLAFLVSRLLNRRYLRILTSKNMINSVHFKPPHTRKAPNHV
jgi:hypothetical protein